LKGYRLYVPSLRERREDIPELLAAFTANRSVEFAPSAIDWMMDYNWPGNVRELKAFVTQLMLSAMETAASGGRTIVERELVESVHAKQNEGMTLLSSIPPKPPDLVEGGIAASGPAAADLEVALRTTLAAGGEGKRLENAVRLLLKAALAMHGGSIRETASYLGVNRNTIANRLRSSKPVHPRLDAIPSPSKEHRLTALGESERIAESATRVALTEEESGSGFRHGSTR
jgi:DNA-binding NtrC family response regulator